MDKEVTSVWGREQPLLLAATLADITNLDEMKNFLRDVMTEKEIEEIGARFRAAQMLLQGMRYSDIVKETKLSSRTVARISDWLKNGTGGYSQVITHHSHLPPVRA